MNRAAGLRFVEQKVEDFHKNEPHYLTKAFQETETRNRFIDPLFQALGWDFEQTHLPRDEWDVHREFSQKERDTIKKPDYAFRVKRKPRFFVEAKAPHVPLTDKQPVFQAKKYAFSSHGKVPVIVITDFQEFRVFNAYQKPLYDNPLQGLIKDLDLLYTQYPAKWDLLWDTFSKEAVLDGSIDLLAKKVARNTKTLDDEFLTDLTAWRELLARNIAVRNPQLTADELNECVQRILDRFIFIRNLEDREIEHEDGLATIAETREGIYPALLPIFRTLDAEYNGLLFKKHLSEELTVDDEVLKKIIKAISPRTSPYQFDIIEPEILGRIYERFLGSKIRLTEGHRAKVEEKPEVRHAGGVYYTPQWVVDYIVEHTVGEKIKGKTPAEIETLKILDPACGSGSFLLGAFDRLIQYHEEWYGVHKKDKAHARDWYQTAEGDIRLTVEKKGRILKNNLFGVDIDREATEVAIMSLYLKLLDKGFDKGQMMLLMKGTVLPNLTANIKCGNSLIDFAFYADEQMNLFEDTDKKRVNAFDWKSEFPSVMKAGGFDVVIGNPPYIRIQTMKEWAPLEVEYYKKAYKSAASGNYDIYVVFVEKGLGLLNPQGRLGFILPHKFFNAKYGQGLREIISHGKHLSHVVHFGDQQVFLGATTYTCLMFVDKQGASGCNFHKVSELSTWSEKGESQKGDIPSSKVTDSEWNFSVGATSSLLARLATMRTKLSDIAHLFVGLQTDADDVYILEEIRRTANRVLCHSKATDNDHWFESSHLKPFLKGSLNIRRYRLSDVNKLLIFPYQNKESKSSLIKESEYKESYPLTWQYLIENRQRLASRNKGRMGADWYGYVYKKNHTRFGNPKILVPSLASGACFALDLEGKYYFVGSGGGGGGGYAISLHDYDEAAYFYLLGVLNSSLTDLYIRSVSTSFRGGYIALNRQYIESIPIISPTQMDPDQIKIMKKISQLARQMVEFGMEISNYKEHKQDILQRQIDATDQLIDQLVFQLYVLSDEEICVVDGSRE